MLKTFFFKYQLCRNSWNYFACVEIMLVFVGAPTRSDVNNKGESRYDVTGY